MRRILGLVILAVLVPVGALRFGHPSAQAQRAAVAQPAAPRSAAHARTGAHAFAPSCSATLRLTPNAFSIVYTAHQQDMSDLAVDNAAAYWAGCRQQATTAATASSPELSAQVARLRTLLGAVQDTETSIVLLYTGGGTLYTHLLNRAATDREQTLADVAALSSGNLASASASGYALSINPTLQDIAARLQRVQHPTKRDLQFTKRAVWDKAVAAYAGAVHAAEAASGTHATAARAVILSFIDQPIYLDQLQ
jgi:hypothetical protein